MMSAAQCEIATTSPRYIRTRCRANGWSPIPAQGKRPLVPGWQRHCTEPASQEDIDRWSATRPELTNTGIACGAVVAIDIDALDETLADRVVALAVEHFGATPLIRYGQRPKVL